MLHKNIVPGDQHVVHNWEYADAVARTAATGFTAADLKKLALQIDTNTLWILTSTVPTWVSVGDAGFDYNIQTIITDTEDLAFNSYNIVVVTAADKTLTLPEIASAGDYGKQVVISVASTTTVCITIDGYGTAPGNYIDGAQSRIMWAGESATLVATAYGWNKIAGKTIPMVAKLRVGTMVSVPTGTITKALTNTPLVSACPPAMLDITNSRIVIKRQGIYQAFASMKYDTVSAGLYETLLYVNGSSEGNNYKDAPVGSSPNSVQLNSAIALEVGNYLEVYALHYAGSSQTLDNGPLSSIAAVELPQW